MSLPCNLERVVTHITTSTTNSQQNINSITATNNFTHTKQSTPITIIMYPSTGFTPESSAPTSPTETTHGYFPSLIHAKFGPQPIQCPHSTRCECTGCSGCKNEIFNWSTMQCSNCNINCPA
ncbi:hypothetical protein ACJA88_002222 [Fusarium oxysporum]